MISPLNKIVEQQVKWHRNVARLSVLCARSAALTLLVGAVISLAAISATGLLLKFNSDKESLVAETAPFKTRNKHFDKAFPQFLNSLMIVIDGPDDATVQDAALIVSDQLHAAGDRFKNVFLGESDPFFQRQGLLFLSPEEIERLVDRLAKIEPALATLGSDPSLRGILDLVELGTRAEENGETLTASFHTVLDQLLDAVARIENGEAVQPLHSLFDRDQGPVRRVIVVQPALDYSSQSAERASVNHVRMLLQSPNLKALDVRIRLTGRVALADDEIWAIQDSVALASLLSTLFAGGLLWFALRSWRLISAILITLFVGLIWTIGFAALSIGSLNMISAAVIVLFIGLGIDHGIHFTLRYREALEAGLDQYAAIETAAFELGGPILLCATTSAIGFAAFIPTDYRGLAELGFIAAASLFLAFAACFTLLPALLTVLRTDKVPASRVAFVQPRFVAWLTERSTRLSGFVVVAALVAVLIAGMPVFDFSTLAIRDTSSESVTTLVELQEDGTVTDYAADMLVNSQAEADALSARLRALHGVRSVTTPLDLVPADQGLKLDLLSDARGFLWSALSAERLPVLTIAERHAAIVQFATVAASLEPSSPISQKVQSLSQALSRLANSADGPAQLEMLDKNLTEHLERNLTWLRQALSPDPVQFEDLPQTVRDRQIGRHGEIRVTAISSDPLQDTQSLRQFVEAIRTIAPEATGRAFTEVEVGALVVRSFYEAGLMAFVGIALLLCIVLRSFIDALFVIAPLLLAACFTIATAALFNITFNFANIVVLPLIFGLGVDSGIHFVMRRRAAETIEGLMKSSTPQAILLSALSTIGAFSALSLSRHWGLASMGILLTIAVFWVIISTIIVLPALMDWREKRTMRRLAAT